MMTTVKLLASLLLALVMQQACADDGASITPYRPSVSNPAQLPTPGQLELEFGGLREKDGDAYHASLPYLFKFAFSKEWGMLLGGEAHVWLRDEQGNRADSIGDTTLTLKRAFILTKSTAFGTEFGVRIPTASHAIGNGNPEYTVNGIYSQDLGRVHLDANLNATRVGMAEPGTGRMQTGFSAAFAMPLAAHWKATAELSGMQRRGTATTAQLLTAVVYSPNKRLAIDVGVVKGLNQASPDWAIFSGIVIPIARLR